MQGKDSIGRLRRKPLGFISSPLIWKRTICGIRVVAGDDVHVSYYVYYKICPNADFTRPMYMGLWGFFLVNWADIIPQKVLFSQFHKLWIYNNVLIYFMQKVYLVNFYTYSFSPEGLFEIRHYKQLS